MLLHSRNKATKSILFKCASTLLSALPPKEQFFSTSYGAQAVMTWKGDDKTCSNATPSMISSDEKRKWGSNTKKENTGTTCSAAQTRNKSPYIPKLKSSDEKRSVDQTESKNSSISARNPHPRNTQVKGELCQPGHILIVENKYNDSDLRPRSVFKIDTAVFSINASNIPLIGHSEQIMGCCNELLCTTGWSQSGDIIKIYNTNTNEHMLTLPKTKEDPYVKHNATYAFGFDPIGNKYKVVKVSRPYYYDTEEHDYEIDTSDKETRVEIFTLGESCWRKQQVPCHVRFGFHPFFLNPEAVFLDGCFHWEIENGRDSPCAEAILALDITTEKFHTIDLPSFEEDPRRGNLINLGNSLAFIDRAPWASSSFDILKVVGSNNNGRQFEHYSVSESGLNERGDITWLGVLNDGNHLLRVQCSDTCENHLAIYNLGTKEYSKLDLPGLPKYFNAIRALVSPTVISGNKEN